MNNIFRLTLLTFLSACSGTTSVGLEAPSGLVSRGVVLSEETWIYYGSSSVVSFDVGLGLSPPLHDCSRAYLQAVATNPRENFYLPSNQATLSIKLSCLRCQSPIGRIAHRRVTGIVKDEDLKGTHFRIISRSPEHSDRFGLSLESGTRGVAEIHSITNERDDCWVLDSQ